MRRILFHPSGRLALILPVLMLWSTLAADARLRQGEWLKLGERTVSHTVDHSELVLDGVQQDLGALKMRVKKGAINLHRCVVYYKNGQTEDVTVLNSIPQGGESKVIELPSPVQTVSKLVFTYDTKNRGIQRAEVELWGRRN